MNLEQISKEINKNGLLISKEKLLEMIKKSPEDKFSIQQLNNQRIKIIVIQTWRLWVGSHA